MEICEVRNHAMSLLFEYSFRKDENPEDIYNLYIEMNGIKESKKLHSYFSDTIANLDFIDGEIKQYAVGWSFERISPLALAVLRLSVYEMYFRDNIPDLVTISDALRIMDDYDNDVKRKKFVNGILNTIYNSRKSNSSSDGEEGK